MSEVYSQELEMAASQTEAFISGLDEGLAVVVPHFAANPWQSMKAEEHLTMLVKRVIDTPLELDDVSSISYDTEGACAHAYGVLASFTDALHQQEKVGAAK